MGVLSDCGFIRCVMICVGVWLSVVVSVCVVVCGERSVIVGGFMEMCEMCVVIACDWSVSILWLRGDCVSLSGLWLCVGWFGVVWNCVFELWCDCWLLVLLSGV